MEEEVSTVQEHIYENQTFDENSNQQEQDGM